MTLLVIAVAGYYGVENGPHYLHWVQLKQEMRTQAGFAPGIDDDAIRRRLARKIEDLGLPEEALRNLRIRRMSSRHEIVISTSYVVTYTLPFRVITDTLKPEVRNPL